MSVRTTCGLAAAAVFFLAPAYGVAEPAGAVAPQRAVLDAPAGSARIGTPQPAEQAQALPGTVRLAQRGGRDPEDDPDDQPQTPSRRGGGGGGGGDDDYFEFVVCNKSRSRVSVAITYLADVGSEDFYVRGWYNVNAGDCDRIGSFPKGYFYYYAKQYRGEGHWPGKDLQFCVEFPGPFKRLNREGYRCGKSEQLRTFHAKVIDSPKFTWTLNP